MNARHVNAMSHQEDASYTSRTLAQQLSEQLALFAPFPFLLFDFLRFRVFVMFVVKQLPKGASLTCCTVSISQTCMRTVMWNCQALHDMQHSLDRELACLDTVDSCH